VYWVEVLNRGLDGGAGPAGATLWHAVAPPAAVLPAALTQWEQDLQLLRTGATHRVLGRDAIAAAVLSQWVTAVTLRASGAESRAGFAWPALRARRSSTALPLPAEELLSTALVDLFAQPVEGLVARCAGVVRGTAPAGFAAADEREFARRAGLAGLIPAGLCQCAHFVATPRAGRYCSKSCSNASFVLRKAARDPRYFSRKQASYRDRQKQRIAPARLERAFSFID
jgi:hypothetical protein